LLSDLEEISTFDPRTTHHFAVPNSGGSMHLSEGPFVCNFGGDSRLQELVVSEVACERAGFMWLSERSLKLIRLKIEWSESTDARPSDKPAFDVWGV
jgi:hypothetical protein